MMSRSRDFDWNDVVDDVVIPEQAAIAVFVNPQGDVVIRQAGQYGPDEDMWIIVAPDRAAVLADAIVQATAFHGTQPDDSKPAAAKDRTAADRQRRYRERQRNGDRDVAGRDDTMPLLLENSSTQAEAME